ncbi:hypothetical protein SB658_26625, partial [Bacillus sp. SIMBA_008]
APTAAVQSTPVAEAVAAPAPAVAAPASVAPEPVPASTGDDLLDLGAHAAMPAPAGKPGWRDRLRNSGFARSFGGLFSRNPR